MSKRKLLLADDSVTIQKVVNLTFADEGIEVITTGDGNSAMEKLHEIKPDLVMADVNMPGLNGYQICEQIKHNEATSQTPVILLVGSFEPFDEERARAAGADDYLTKPFQSIRQLVSKVTQLLGGDMSGESSGKLPEETLKMETPIPEYQPDQFDDSEIDDDMIQTSQSENYSSYDMPGFTGQTRTEEDTYLEEQPDLQVEDEFSTPETKVSGQNTFETAEEEPEQIEDKYTADFEESYAERFEESEKEADEFSAQQPESDSATSEDYFSSEELPESEEDSQHYFREPDQEAENYEEESKTASADEIPQPVSPSILELDEFDLLDLPPIGVEEETVKEEETQPQSEEQAATETLQTVEEDEVKTEVSRQFSSVDLSPEVIEAIADKVVEKLSRKLKE